MCLSSPAAEAEEPVKFQIDMAISEPFLVIYQDFARPGDKRSYRLIRPSINIEAEQDTKDH